MIESLLCCLQLDLERIERGAGIYVIDGFEKIVQDRSTDRIEEARPELKHLGVLISVLATHIKSQEEEGLGALLLCLLFSLSCQMDPTLPHHLLFEVVMSVFPCRDCLEHQIN